MIIFDPSMPVGEIQATVDAIYAQQVDAEMSTNRYAFLFKPGVYGTATEPLQMKVGYYTEVAGLGASPTEVTINGKIEVYNRCLENGGTSNCVALVNFWRTLSNLTLNINSLDQDGCRASANFWAVSQAVSMRRLNIGGANLSLMDYCTAGPQFASGGFIADSNLPFVINGSQQQWLIRNSRIGGWSNAVWNQVFAGVEGAPSEASFPNPPYTTLETTPVSREKPYLFIDDRGKYSVRVPSAQTDTRGISWADGLTAGRTIPLDQFFIATPSDSVKTINRELVLGRNLLLTPGVYDVGTSIFVKRADTVVLGIGHPTLTAVDGAVPLTVNDVPGVIIAGVTIDAGTVESPMLLQVGKKPKKNAKSDPSNPTTLSDVYFRVGGPHIGKADVALEVNSNDVLIDHTWVWRADHGVEGFSGDTERWNTNIGRNGVVVNGDGVTATGLFVEHFQQYNTDLERPGRHDDPVPERAAVRSADPGGLDARRHRRLGRVQGRRPGDDAQPLRGRCVRLQPEQPVDPHRERLRGSGDPGRPVASHHDRQPERGYDRPRGQRRRRPGRYEQHRRTRVHRRLPVTHRSS